jgi:uncharacterized protein
MSTTTQDRIHAIDALRGFALWGIIAVHVTEQFLGGYPPPGMADYAVHTPVDVWFKALNKSIFLSKFFTIFSLLFGLSFFIQMDRAARRGQPFAGRFAWRLALLFGIGLLHNGFFRGDILTVYALLGLLLIPFQKASDRALLGVALAVVAGLPRYLLLGAKLLFFAPRTAAEEAAFETFNFQYFYLAREGGFAELFLRNLHPGWLMKMEFQFDLFGRGYLTFALFLLGLWLGRTRFFEQYGEKKKMIWQLFIAAVVLALATEPLRKALLAHYDLRSWRTAIGLTVQDIHNLAFSAALVLGFLLLTLMEKTRKLWLLLAPYGRMALSHYVGQSILGGFFFFGWGLGLLGRIGAAEAFLLGQGIFWVQLAFSKLWLRSFRYGPLEWLWRSGTYRKWQPLRKE